MITASKSLPVKIWLDGEETFNQQVIPGKDKVKFVQPWIKSKPVVFQFLDSEKKDYRIRVKKLLDDSTLSTSVMTRTELDDGSYVYQTSIDVSALDDGKYYFQIISVVNNLTVSITGLLGAISSTLENQSVIFRLSADIDGLMGVISSTLKFNTYQSDAFKISNSELSVCGAADTTLYWASGAWGIGTQMFTDAGLTEALTGYTHIINGLGSIHTLSGNTVDTDTGVFC